MDRCMRKVALAGASGTFGRSILHALLEANFTVTVLTRNSSAVNFDSALGLHNIIETDYSATSLAKALQGQDALVSAVGVPGIPSQIVMINAAEHAGVKRFVLSEFGYAPEHARLPELLFMRASRDKVLDYVRSKTGVNPNFTWSAVATGPPIDMVIKRFPLAFGFDTVHRHARIYDGGTEMFTATTTAGVGKAVAGLLAHPLETANRFVRVRSVQTTQNDVLAAFEQVMGEKWSVTPIDCHEFMADVRIRLATSHAGVVPDLVAVQLFEKGARRSIVATKETSDNILLGVQEECLQSIIKEVLRMT